MLKPMLARGELRMIGATTLDEYRERIEKDPALERRFQQVFVGEPSVEDTIAILRGLKEKYEAHHGVRITDAALVAAATLSDRYITGRQLPDKAIDLVDEAASRLRMEIDSSPGGDRRAPRAGRPAEDGGARARQGDRRGLARPPGRAPHGPGRPRGAAARARGPLGPGEVGRWTGVGELQSQLDELRIDAERPSARATSPSASEILYGRIPELEKQLAQVLAAETSDVEPHGRARRSARDDIAEVVEAWTGIPAGRLLEGETEKLLRMEEELGRRLIGQQPRRRGRVRRGAPLPGRHLRPRPPDRLVPVPRADGRRQDRAGQVAGRLPVRRRARDGPDRHERVRREAQRGPPGRCPSRLRRLRGGRPADRGGPAPAVHAWCCSTRSRRPTPRSSTSCSRCSMTVGSPTGRAAPWTSATSS